MNADRVIEKLGLVPLEQEGGMFCRTYESTTSATGGTPACAAIYYLLRGDDFSHLHRLSVDEMYHFYLGDPVELIELLPGETGRKTILGHGIDRGQQVQKLVRAGTWQGAALADGGSWALLGTTTCPAYSQECYEHGDGPYLAAEYPEWAEAIACLAR